MSAGEHPPATSSDPRPPAAGPGYYSDVANPTQRPNRRRLTLYGIMVVGFLLCWGVLIFEFGSGLGLRTTVLAALFAAIPLFVVVPTYLWVDRYEAEPVRFLLFGFAWGALCAAVGALFLNTFFSLALRLAGNENADTLSAVISAPVVEEGLKGLGILLIIVLRRRQFDGVIDGIVYAGMIGAGFAFSENILYLGRIYQEYGGAGLTQLFFLRCVMGPFAHPLFTAMTGIGLGLAVSVMRTRATQVIAGLAGYLGAMILHAVWNLSASTGNIFGAYLAFQVPFFLCFLGLLAWLRLREGRTIRRYLSQYADAGWLTPPEVAMLGSLSTRRQARSWARQHGGPGAVASMRSFQDSAADLALLRSRMARGAAEPDAQARERVLLEAMVAHRWGFLGTPAIGPAGVGPPAR
ncbi:MAG: PrsW family intramembrane metalloprotease [Lapillicoccus sp.]